jgi:hypothetical protein
VIAITYVFVVVVSPAVTIIDIERTPPAVSAKGAVATLDDAAVEATVSVAPASVAVGVSWTEETLLTTFTL